MHTKFQPILCLVLSGAAAAFAQTIHCGIEDRYYPYYPYDRYGFPYEDRYSVSVLDYPLVEKPKTLEPVKTHPVVDPIQARLEKRMAEIDSAGFANTNKTKIEIVPGLTPKN